MRVHESATAPGRPGPASRREDTPALLYFPRAHPRSRRSIDVEEVVDMQARAFAGRRLAAPLITAVLLLMPGCLRVVRHEAPYYADGPHQVEGPNGFLEGGKHVMVFGEKDSYSHILTFDGISGYVLSGSLATYSEWRQQQEQEKEERERARDLTGEQ